MTPAVEDYAAILIGNDFHARKRALEEIKGAQGKDLHALKGLLPVLCITLLETGDPRFFEFDIPRRGKMDKLLRTITSDILAAHPHLMDERHPTNHKNMLALCLRDGFHETARLLVERGSNLFLKFGGGHSIRLEHYIISGRCPESFQYELIDRLWESGQMEDHEKCACLLTAASFGKEGMVPYLLKKGADGARLDNMQSPIMAMVQVLNYNEVKLLIEAGCDATLRDQDGNTALHYLARVVSDFPNSLDAQEIELMDILTQAGCDPLAQNYEGETMKDLTNAPEVWAFVSEMERAQLNIDTQRQARSSSAGPRL